MYHWEKSSIIEPLPWSGVGMDGNDGNIFTISNSSHPAIGYADRFGSFNFHTISDSNNNYYNWSSIAVSSNANYVYITSNGLGSPSGKSGIYRIVQNSLKETSALKLYWNSIRCDRSGKYIVASATNASLLDVISGGVYYSRDFGSSWYKSWINNKEDTNYDFRSVSMDSGGSKVIICNSLNIYLSSNYGKTFLLLRPAPIINEWISVNIASNSDSDLLRIVGVLKDCTVYYTEYVGIERKWMISSGVDACVEKGYASMISNEDGRTLVLGFPDDTNNGLLYVSSNYGQSFQTNTDSNSKELSGNWRGVTINNDGSRIVAVSHNDAIYYGEKITLPVVVTTKSTQWNGLSVWVAVLGSILMMIGLITYCINRRRTPPLTHNYQRIEDPYDIEESEDVVYDHITMGNLLQSQSPDISEALTLAPCLPHHPLVIKYEIILSKIKYKISDEVLKYLMSCPWERNLLRDLLNDINSFSSRSRILKYRVRSADNNNYNLVQHKWLEFKCICPLDGFSRGSIFYYRVDAWGITMKSLYQREPFANNPMLKDSPIVMFVNGQASASAFGMNHNTWYQNEADNSAEGLERREVESLIRNRFNQSVSPLEQSSNAVFNAKNFPFSEESQFIYRTITDITGKMKTETVERKNADGKLCVEQVINEDGFIDVPSNHNLLFKDFILAAFLYDGIGKPYLSVTENCHRLIHRLLRNLHLNVPSDVLLTTSVSV